MQIDKITFNDIAIFHPEEEFSIFHKLNFTRTQGGREWLRRFFNDPHGDLKKITGTQNIIQTIIDHLDEWPLEITNGTIIVVEKFLDYNLDPVPQSLNPFNTLSYKLLHSADFSMVRYSVRHFADFFRGLKKLSQLLDPVELPGGLHYYIDRINKLLKEEPLRRLANTKADAKFSRQENLYFAHHLRTEYRSATLDAIDIFSRLDAWYSMAVAVKTFNLHFPKFIESTTPYIKSEGLYHILLQHPMPYDLVMNPEQNF